MSDNFKQYVPKQTTIKLGGGNSGSKVKKIGQSPLTIDEMRIFLNIKNTQSNLGHHSRSQSSLVSGTKHLSKENQSINTVK